MKDLHSYGMKYSIRMKSFEGDSIHDIKDFYINDAEDNKFISDLNDLDFNLLDAQYFIITGFVFKDIIEKLCKEQYDLGYKQGQKEKIKKVQENEPSNNE